MYDALVKELRELSHEFYLDDNNKYAEEKLNEAADAIEELDMITDNLNYLYKEATTWIPVTERLPEEKTYVLISADTIAGKMAKVSFLYKDHEGKNCWTGLDVYGLKPCDWQPTHWMPLPDPPKEETC